jgi:hypothetical protein
MTEAVERAIGVRADLGPLILPLRVRDLRSRLARPVYEEFVCWGSHLTLSAVSKPAPRDGCTQALMCEARSGWTNLLRNYT